VAGAAFTVQGIGGDNLALHRAVATAPPGSVVVADLQAAAYGHWGEILAVAAQQRGIAGVVVDGGVRDVAEQAALGFPVFARHVTVVGTGKEHPGRFGVPVRVGGVVVRVGDLVVGDADGVVVIPAASVATTLDRADARVASEQRALEAIRHGVTTIEYYHLSAEFSETESPSRVPASVSETSRPCSPPSTRAASTTRLPPDDD
jgi:4-hydroxy-4-methyl-2-oxoglutarate aldolase